MMLDYTYGYAMSRKAFGFAKPMKKLIFVSNYANHHQMALSKEFIKIYGDSYGLIATIPLESERLNGGWHDMNHEPFVIRTYDSKESAKEAQKIIDEAECVVIGSAPLSMLKNRIKNNKITFLYSERIFKGPKWKDIVRFIKYVWGGGRDGLSHLLFTCFVLVLLSLRIITGWDSLKIDAISGDIFLK